MTNANLNTCTCGSVCNSTEARDLDARATAQPCACSPVCLCSDCQCGR